MRILFTFAGGSGHLAPLLPLAGAAVSAGHTVAFIGPARMLAVVEGAGFRALRTAPPPPPEGGRAPRRRPLREVDMAREERDLRERFAGPAAGERARAVLAVSSTWRPDVLVCDETDFGAPVAAERLGLPYALVLVLAAGSLVRPDVVAAPIDALRAEHGLDPDPTLEARARHLVLAPFPPRFRDPASPLPHTGHHLRPLPPEPAVAAPPPWLETLGGPPLVYATLGTDFNLESGDLFARLLAGLGDLSAGAVLTVGRGFDPGELDPRPGNVHVEQFVPQSLVLPRCEAVVCHGGSGTVMGALAHGLPLVLLPMGADQPLNAERCAALGAGVVLDALRASPGEVAAAVRTVLTDAAYREAAGRLRREIEALDGPDVAVRRLERIAGTG